MTTEFYLLHFKTANEYVSDWWELHEKYVVHTQRADNEKSYIRFKSDAEKKNWLCKKQERWEASTVAEFKKVTKEELFQYLI